MYAMRLQSKPIFIFPHYKSMETLSCHSNQSTYAMAKKKIVLLSIVMNISAKFQLYPHIASEELTLPPNLNRNLAFWLP